MVYRKSEHPRIVLKRTASGAQLLAMGREWPLITTNYSRAASKDSSNDFTMASVDSSSKPAS